jgi:alpha-1,6-mannosyltransferase
MKICDLSQFYSDRGGGIRTYLDTKHRYIQANTDNYHVLIVPGATDSYQEEGRLKIYRVKGVRIPGSVGYRFIFRLDKVFSILMRERPDIIEFATPYLLPWVVYWFQKFHPCLSFGFYHTDFPHAYVNMALSRLTGPKFGTFFEKIAYRYARFVYSRCDRTITASRLFARKLSAIGIQATRAIPFGIDLDLYHPQNRDEKFRRQFVKHNDDILLLYSGRFDGEKRVLFLLEVLKELEAMNKFSLIMVGDGPLRCHLENVAQNNQRLHILSFKSDKAALAKIYASADIYVTAGAHETFGFCIAEAQASGLPVVGVNAGALIERVPETLGFLGPVDSQIEMAQNIRRISALDFRNIGRKNRLWVEQNNSWENFFQQLFNCYETAITPHQKTVPSLTEVIIPIHH